jgi:hypothetical protein
MTDYAVLRHSVGGLPSQMRAKAVQRAPKGPDRRPLLRSFRGSNSKRLNCQNSLQLVFDILQPRHRTPLPVNLLNLYKLSILFERFRISDSPADLNTNIPTNDLFYRNLNFLSVNAKISTTSIALTYMVYPELGTRISGRALHLKPPL